MPIDKVPAVKLLVDTLSSHNIPYQFIGEMADAIHSQPPESVPASTHVMPQTIQIELPQSQMELASYVLRQYKTSATQFAESEGFRSVQFSLVIDGVNVTVSQLENSQVLTKNGWCNLTGYSDLNKSEVRVWHNTKLKVQPLAAREQVKALLN